MAGLSGYFDYAAATPVDDNVLKAMQPFFIENFYNPSASYKPARDVRQAIEQARFDVAQILGVKPAELVFTAGGTEANNLAIAGVMQTFPEGNLVISSIEHDSIRSPASNYKHKECPVNPKGIVDADNLLDLIDDQTVLVSVMYANNEIGSIQPIRKISHALEKISAERKRKGNKLPLYFHTDAAQAANYLDLHAHRLGVDLMSLNGGKIYGPKQSGLLYVRGGIILRPQITGGGQERKLRSGTENVPGIIGLAEALKIAAGMQNEETVRMKQLQAFFMSEISAKIPQAEFNGSLKNRLPNNVHITIPGQDNERLLILLDEQGICAAAGSACSASHEEPSHVLRAIGLDDDQIHASIRFTMGKFTKKQDISDLISHLASVLA